jgi:hypothetical protein
METKICSGKIKQGGQSTLGLFCYSEEKMVYCGLPFFLSHSLLGTR